MRRNRYSRAMRSLSYSRILAVTALVGARYAGAHDWGKLPKPNSRANAGAIWPNITGAHVALLAERVQIFDLLINKTCMHCFAGRGAVNNVEVSDDIAHDDQHHRNLAIARPVSLHASLNFRHTSTLLAHACLAEHHQCSKAYVA